MPHRVTAAHRTPSAFVLLRTQASRRPAATALVEPVAATGPGVTWSELFHAVEVLAAALLGSGVRAGQVALVATAPGRRTVTVELALRSIGVVPVRLGPGTGVSEAAATLGAAPVSLVVVDDPAQVDSFVGLPLGRARLLDIADDDGLAALAAAGRTRLHQEPDVVARADQRVAPADTAPRLITPGGEALALSAQVRRPVLLTPRDRVLLVGDPRAPYTQHVRMSCLAAGANLMWIGDPGHLATALQDFRPTVLALDPDATLGLEPLLLAAHLGHRPWHSAPGSVLDAVVAMAAGGHVARGTRRRASAIVALKPWFGGELTQLLVAMPCSERLRAACESLDIDVDLDDVGQLDHLDLPRAVVRRRELPRLPHRRPSPVDPAFTALVAPSSEDAEEPDDTSLSDWTTLPPLILGESFLDRLLAHQAAGGHQASAVTT